MTVLEHKQLKRKSAMYQYLLSVTAIKSAKKFEDYSLDELVEIFKNSVNEDYKALSQMKK